MDAADKVDDCWRSRLLPEGEIVTIGRGGIPWFVVRVYDNTVLLWEGEWKETCFRFKFADDLELVYMPIYDLSDVLVYPTKAVSPLSRRTAGCKSMSSKRVPQSEWKSFTPVKLGATSTSRPLRFFSMSTKSLRRS